MCGGGVRDGGARPDGSEEAWDGVFGLAGIVQVAQKVQCSRAARQRVRGRCGSKFTRGQRYGYRGGRRGWVKDVAACRSRCRDDVCEIRRNAMGNETVR